MTEKPLRVGPRVPQQDLIDAVNALNPAAADNQPYGEWDAAKWKVFNAAVRFVHEQDESAGSRVPSPPARFFRHVKGFDDDTLFVRADGDRLTLLLADGRAEPYEFPGASLAHCLAKVEQGIWREHELLRAAGVAAQEPDK